MSHQKYIPLASPDIKSEDIDAVVSVLKSGMLVQGQQVLALEQKCANFIGVNHVSATSNGTSTMHMALVALGISAGDEVIVPALSYIATANVVELVGATPIFVDIDINTFNIDLSKIEAAITKKTKAIIPVHEFGLAANMTAIKSIADKYNLKIIEDAACAIGATHQNIAVGTFGDFASFSLHPRKAITSGEGGLLVSKTENDDRTIKTLRNHGIAIEDGKMNFVAAGFNYRLTDIQAALVSSQFNRLSSILEQKQAFATIYQNTINQSKYQVPFAPEGSKHSWQTFHLICESEAFRNYAITALQKKGIGTNYGAQCIPSQTFYQKKYKLDSKVLFPNALAAFTKGLAIPLYEKLDLADIEYITTQLNTI